jgi:glutaredoxin-related protein
MRRCGGLLPSHRRHARVRRPRARAQIAKDVAENKVVVFMKGVPDAPQCGFSNTVTQACTSCCRARVSKPNVPTPDLHHRLNLRLRLHLYLHLHPRPRPRPNPKPEPNQILKAEGAPFTGFNVLADADLRNGIKTYSNWPTIPQGARSHRAAS